MKDFFGMIWDIEGWMECIIMMSMLARIFEHRENEKKCWLYGIGFWMIFVICNSIVIVCNVKYGLISEKIRFASYAILIMLVAFGFSVLTLKGNWRQFLTTILFYKSCVIFLSFLYKAFEEYRRNLFGNDMISNMAASVLAIVLMFLISEICRKISHPIRTRISDGYWLIAWSTPVCLIWLWVISYPSMNAGSLTMVELNLLMLVITLLGYELFLRLVGEMEKQMELNLDNQSLMYQIRQMNDAEKMLQQARTARHEIKNMYFYLETLLELKKYDEMQKFFEETIWPEFDRYEMISTGDRLVDMILSNKIAEARQRNIPIVFDVLLSEEMHVQKQILCSLISNLLDNAIEASKSVREPDIFFSMYEMKGYLAIEVRNKIDASVLKKNPKLITTKSDKTAHGIGMKIVRQITDSYDGRLEITEENSNFIVRVYL